jgi:hypothetical protein
MAMRAALFPSLLWGVLALTPCVAAASPNYPGAIVQYLDITCADGGVPPSWGCPGPTPGCLLCHTVCTGGLGTATEPFAENLQAYGLGPGAVTLLQSALMEEATDDIYSAGHCVDDVETLKVCQNPNIADAGGDASYCPKAAVTKDGGKASSGGSDAGVAGPPSVTVPIAPPTYGCIGRVAGTSSPDSGGAALIFVGLMGALVVYRRRSVALAHERRSSD